MDESKRVLASIDLNSKTAILKDDNDYLIIETYSDTVFSVIFDDFSLDYKTFGPPGKGFLNEISVEGDFLQQLKEKIYLTYKVNNRKYFKVEDLFKIVEEKYLPDKVKNQIQV